MLSSFLTKYKKIAAGILGMLLLLIMLFSAFCIAAEADHDCTGEDCPICASLQQCENTLYRMDDGTASGAFIAIPVVFLFIPVFLFKFGFPEETLVSKKVRLNN